MNGAEVLARTLVTGGVDVCFANPGTSEMHFVSALDRVPAMRCVLALFEGVATGAADGFYRMADKPACTLLHLGPGLSNGSANLHNALKARSGIVNVVGQHATWHLQHDAPLTSDIEGLARPVSHWVRSTASASDVGADTADALAEAYADPGRIATLVLPGDAAWNEAGEAPGAARAAAGFAPPDNSAIDNAARVLRSGEPTLLLIGGKALRERGLELAGRIAARAGCALATRFFNARVERGAGRVPAMRLAYAVDPALAELRGFSHIVMVHAEEPVGFFAYPGKPSLLKPEGCQVHTLCGHDQDPNEALEALASTLGAAAGTERRQPLGELAKPRGALNPESIAQAIAATMPEDCIVVDESITTGRRSFALTAGARPHDWLQNMGGSIGFGTPAATGAAIACPNRRVVCLEGDGSGMYTLQSLWTHARESLDVTTVVFANRRYQILLDEFANVGAGNPGPSAMSMLDIDRPALDWLALAKGMGVPGRRVESAWDLAVALDDANGGSGPFVIEVLL
jgi:acetolactate synthase-1/2/3 large subunit